jgi:hypothetical protein
MMYGWAREEMASGRSSVVKVPLYVKALEKRTCPPAVQPLKDQPTCCTAITRSSALHIARQLSDVHHLCVHPSIKWIHDCPAVCHDCPTNKNGHYIHCS